MAGNGYVPSRNILDELDKKSKAAEISKSLREAKADFIAEKHDARRTASKPKGDNSAYQTARSKVTMAQSRINQLEKELEATTGVSDSDRIGLTFGGAMAGMGASYVGAGGTLLKGADMTGRIATDTDVLIKRGDIAGQKYEARRHISKPKGDNSAHRAERADTQQLQRELRELVADKEARHWRRKTRLAC